MKKNALLNSIQKLIVTALLLISNQLCLADIAIIVHPNNPNESFTPHQIKKLFLGRLRMLPNTELEPIIIDQEDSQKSRQYFYSRFIKMNSTALKRYRAAYLFSGKGKLPINLENDDEVKSFVAENISAVGYINAAISDDSVKTVYKILSE